MFSIPVFRSAHGGNNTCQNSHEAEDCKEMKDAESIKIYNKEGANIKENHINYIHIT